MRNPRIAAIAMATALAIASIHAEEGRTPIFEPTVISEPGSYVVTRDITGPGLPALIDVQASAGIVDLDLNGFALTSTTGAAIVRGTSLDRLRIHGGTMVFGSAEVTDTKQLIIENVTLSVGDVVGSNVDQFTIRHNEWPLGGGIFLSESNTLVARTGTIEDNELSNGQIAVNGSASNRMIGVAVRNNRVAPGRLALLYHAGCMVTDNRVAESSSIGISFDSSRGCLVSGNTVQSSVSHGISLFGSIENKLLNNVSTQNGGCAIILQGAAYVFLEDNVASKNLECGIAIGSNSNNITLSGNIAGGNLAAPAGFACTNPAITYCPAPYGTGFAAPNYCNDGSAVTLCDNMMPGPPRH